MKRLFRRILVTAGPTQEMLDPVRYLTNRSTGEMGYALARAARKAGYRVTLISGPVALKPPAGVRFIAVNSAADLQKACGRFFPGCDALFMTAAVCDFRLPARKTQKIRRGEKLVLTLEKTPDIVAALGAGKKRRIVVGFCLETEDWLAHARKKLSGKKLDGIVANRLTRSHNPFGPRKIQAALLGTDGACRRLKQQSKPALARELVRWAESLARQKRRIFLGTRSKKRL